ncbi:carboxypeptidase-like regulatory domain-containing protein [Edaphobacter sp.]|uniref:carboxypeptidase-like regulatory domain-containing protein n=1 Tax=Edaphobacter sp. TaxID=1934404 RepID=UPI00345BF164
MRLFAFFFSLFFSSIALAQGASDAVVVGSVTDPNHAGVSGATITLTHVATRATTQVIADADGRYRTPPLRIGEYVLTVQGRGSKSCARRESRSALEISARSMRSFW